MAQEGLKIIVDAEVQGAINNVGKLGQALSDSEKEFADLVKSTGSFTTALDKMVRNGGVSIDFLEKQIKDFRQAFSASMDPTQTKAFGQALVALKSKQQELINSGLDARFANIGKQIKSSISPLRQFVSLIPGLTLSSLLSDSIEGIVEAVANLRGSTFDIREFNNAFAEGAGKSIAGIELLKTKINDTNITQAQRLELVKDYNKNADIANKIDLTQIGNLDLINEKINQQINLLKQRAAVRAAEGIVAQKFEELFKKQLELKIDFPDIESKQQDIIGKATKFIDNINTKLKITPTFDTKELLALSDIPAKQLADLAAKGGKFKIFSDPAAVKTLQRFNSELKSSIALTNNLGQAGVFEKLQADIADAQKAVDETLNAFGKILEVPGFSEKDAKEKVKKAFEAIKVGIVAGLNDVVRLIELNPSALSLPFRLALDEDKFNLEISNVKKQLEAKLHQFDIQPSVIPVPVKLQIEDAAKEVKPLTEEIKQQFADARGATFGLTGLDLSSIFKTEGVQDSLARIFDQLNDIGGALDDIKKRGDFTEFSQKIQKASELLVSTLQPAFNDFFTEVVNGQIRLKTFFESLGEQLKQLAAKLLTNAAIAAILAGVTGGNFMGIFQGLSGLREKGGPVNKGLSYMVNEKGKEIFQPNIGLPRWIEGGPQVFTPDVGGKIIPAHMAKMFATKFDLPKFEFGGLVTGPVFGLLGEGAGISSLNPEVIAPLETLKNLLPSNRSAINVNIQSKTRGTDLTLAISRQERRNKRL